MWNKTSLQSVSRKIRRDINDFSIMIHVLSFFLCKFASSIIMLIIKAPIIKIKQNTVFKKCLLSKLNELDAIPRVRAEVKKWSKWVVAVLMKLRDSHTSKYETNSCDVALKTRFAVGTLLHRSEVWYCARYSYLLCWENVCGENACSKDAYGKNTGHIIIRMLCVITHVSPVNSVHIM